MNNKSRSLVNIIGIPLIITSIIVGNFLFTLFISTIIILGTKEYINLVKRHSIEPSIKLLYIGQIFLIICSIWYTAPQSIHAAVRDLIISYNFIKVQIAIDYFYSIDLIWFTFHFPIILTFLAMIIEIFKKSSRPLLNISTTVFGFIWIGVFLNSLIYVRHLAGADLTLAIFVSLWTCDTFAFFFGKNFGKTKIMPEISPNKTIVGTLSGLFGSIIFLIIISHYNIIDISLINAIILGLITGGVSQFGDFFESKLKREIDIKDTSNILKGHGGILDRFDSLSIISPLLLLFVLIVFKL